MKIFGAHFLISLLVPFIAFGCTLAGPVLLTEHIALDRELIARQNEISSQKTPQLFFTPYSHRVQPSTMLPAQSLSRLGLA
jgi:hypothetical protein